MEPVTSPLRLHDPSRRRSHSFELVPDAEARAALATELGVDAIRKLRFVGAVQPEGSADWRLDAMLGATIVQPCSVTLAPVTTRIDEEVTRRYLAALNALEMPDEAEMPEDDTAEPVPATLRIESVMAEALALAIPAFPRAEDADFGAATFSEPGVTPMSDADARPFAGLRDKLAGKDD